MGYIIKRQDVNEILSKKQWLLLYGRRKVGKTFLLRELCKFENYYTIRQDGGIISGDNVLSSDKAFQEIKKIVSENKVVVIDEFQRLDNSILEQVVLLHPKGKLIISGSSLRIVNKIFEPKSPLLGFFTPIKIGFISPKDTIMGLKGKFEPEKVIELATFLREPWAIPIYNNQKTMDFVYELVTGSKYIITSLIGEIFTEEERELTKKYEAILNLIGEGIWNTKELTSILYSRKFIPDPSPTHLIQYLKNLEEMELVESIKLHKAKGRYYRLTSPIMNIYYYLDSRYNISERNVSLEEIKPTIEKLINLEIQNFIADLFAQLYNGRKEYFISGDKEVDFIITKRNKAEIIGEVKWKRIEKEDINKFMRNSDRLYGKRMIVCKSGEAKMRGVNITSPNYLISLASGKTALY